MVDSAIEGRSYPATAPFEVGRERIREFAEAIGSYDAVHTSPEAARSAGYPDVIAPPTFAIIVSQRAEALVVADPEAKIDYSRVVHGEQRFTHHRPIVVGDRLVGVATIDSVRATGGHTMLTTRVEIATEDGEAVATALSTIVVRGE